MAKSIRFVVLLLAGLGAGSLALTSTTAWAGGGYGHSNGHHKGHYKGHYKGGHYKGGYHKGGHYKGRYKSHGYKHGYKYGHGYKKAYKKGYKQGYKQGKYAYGYKPYYKPYKPYYKKPYYYGYKSKYYGYGPVIRFNYSNVTYGQPTAVVPVQPVQPAPVTETIVYDAPQAAPVSSAHGASGDCLMTREYQTEITVGGQLVPAYGQACLKPDGSWEQGPAQADPLY